jgi:diacylglycerol kinase
MSELVNAVLERTIDEADHEARQRAEAEADMANVMQWISRIQPVGRHASDVITLDLRLT